MIRRIDWILVLQVASLLIAANSAPDEWRETVIFALVFIGLTCGPEHPWGKRANGRATPTGEQHG